MNPILKYSLARLGLFALIAAVLLVLPIPLDRMVVLGIALIVSALLSFILLRGLRNEVAQQMTAGVQRRQAERARLSAALAGDDQPAVDQATVDRAAVDQATVDRAAVDQAAADQPAGRQASQDKAPIAQVSVAQASDVEASDPRRTGTAPST